MPLKTLNQSEIEAVRQRLDQEFPRSDIRIEEDYEVIELDIPEDFKEYLVSIAGSDDELEISYVVNQLIMSYLKEIEELGIDESETAP